MSTVLIALIAALTVGGKAYGKIFAFERRTDIVLFVGPRAALYQPGDGHSSFTNKSRRGREQSPEKEGPVVLSKGRRRLDVLLVERGEFSSRQKAVGAIMAGLVFVNGQRVDKAGTMVPAEAAVEVKGQALPYVSRGGLKLEKALHVFGWILKTWSRSTSARPRAGSPTVCCSTARKKCTRSMSDTDSWTGSSATTSRVVVMERTNARALTRDDLPELVDWVVIDVSFISLAKIFPAASDLLKPGGRLVCLVKPQFEAGRNRVGAKGRRLGSGRARRRIDGRARIACRDGFHR